MVAVEICWHTLPLSKQVLIPFGVEVVESLLLKKSLSYRVALNPGGSLGTFLRGMNISCH